MFNKFKIKKIEIIIDWECSTLFSSNLKKNPYFKEKYRRFISNILIISFINGEVTF